MRSFLSGMAAALLLLALGGGTAIEAGWVDVAATDPHWPATLWLLDQARARSIEAHAAGIQPPKLDDPAMVQAGVEHYAAHCAICHGAPGVPPGDIARGLYPRPPDLDGAARRLGPAELFWVVQHGIKMTGMPAWGDHDDEELWATVAFLEALPGMSEQDYAKLVMTSIQSGGHHHHPGAE